MENELKTNNQQQLTIDSSDQSILDENSEAGIYKYIIKSITINQLLV
jgi:hypothetical protein